jgi:hypothetical protein
MSSAPIDLDDVQLAGFSPAAIYFRNRRLSSQRPA